MREIVNVYATCAAKHNTGGVRPSQYEPFRGRLAQGHQPPGHRANDEVPQEGGEGRDVHTHCAATVSCEHRKIFISVIFKFL